MIIKGMIFLEEHVSYHESDCGQMGIQHDKIWRSGIRTVNTVIDSDCREIRSSQIVPWGVIRWGRKWHGQCAKAKYQGCHSNFALSP